MFDPLQAKVLAIDDLHEGIPECAAIKSKLQDEIRAYKQAVLEIPDSVKPLTFWYSNRRRFPELFRLAIKYLSIPGNSVDAERSVSQYNLINTCRRQNMTEDNLTQHVLLVNNAKKP